MGESGKEPMICNWKHSSDVFGKFSLEAVINRYEALSKQNKGTRFIVSAQRGACTYQTKLFRMEQVPT